MSELLIEVHVTRVATEATDIASYELVRTGGGPLPVFEPGAHIDVHLPGDLVRQYSLCSPSNDPHRYLIAVLRDPASRGGSVALHDKVAAGDALVISPPRNHFPLNTGAGHSLLLGGGIGVTPIMCMAERLWRDGASFEFHYCTRTRARTAFHDALLGADYAARVAIHFDDGADSQRLDIAATLANRDPSTHLYVCGPQGFMDWVLGAARAQGWPEERIHFEYFGHTVEHSADDASFEVELAGTGIVVKVPADISITAALKAQGVIVPVSCEQGVCGTCIARVISGEPDHRDFYLSPREQAANDQMLLCCSRAKSPRLVVDLEQASI